MTRTVLFTALVIAALGAEEEEGDCVDFCADGPKPEECTALCKFGELTHFEEWKTNTQVG